MPAMARGEGEVGVLTGGEVWRPPGLARLVDPPLRLAEFVGLPFGAADAIVRLCAFERMTELGATKAGKTELVIGAVENSSFFRRGVVGDWVNHLSLETAQRIDAITRSKLQGSGLLGV